MSKIKSLKFTEITMSGLRAYENETTILLDDTTLISGGNAKGKSSITHAISYAIYGVSAFGVQDIDNILCDKCDTVKVRLKYLDDNGETHELFRSRTGNETELTLDGYKATQSMLEGIFGDRHLFLSLFNPLYFIEIYGAKGKEMLQLKLPIVKKDEVFKKLSKTDVELLSDIDLTVPDGVLQRLRSEKKAGDDFLNIIKGKLEVYGDSSKSNNAKINNLKAELLETNAKISELEAHQFDNIIIDDLKAERAILDDKIKSGDDVLANLKAKYAEVLSREYVSKYQDEMINLSANLKAIVNNFTEIKTVIANLKVGSNCPTCFSDVTAENIECLTKNLQAKLDKIGSKGKTAKEQKVDLLKLEKQSIDTFEEFIKADKERLEAEIKALEENPNTSNTAILNRINDIDELLLTGNLTDAEYNELCCYRADKVAVETQLSMLKKDSSEADYTKTLQEKVDTEKQITDNNILITAVKNYIEKRSQIALSALKMPNVKIKFHELIKSTGELKDCYIFTYKGHKYSTLSLSEKIKAGIEITAMLRSLCDLDFPIFIDNSESIGRLSECDLPSQTLIMKHITDAEISIKTMSNKPALQVAA